MGLFAKLKDDSVDIDCHILLRDILLTNIRVNCSNGDVVEMEKIVYVDGLAKKGVST